MVPFSERPPQGKLTGAIVNCDPDLLQIALDEGANPNLRVSDTNKNTPLMELMYGVSYLFDQDAFASDAVRRKNLAACVGILLDGEQLLIDGNSIKDKGVSIDLLYGRGGNNSSLHIGEYNSLLADVIIYKLNQDILEGQKLYEPDLYEIFSGLGHGKGTPDKYGVRKERAVSIKAVHDVVREKIILAENPYTQNIAAHSDRASFWLHEMPDLDPDQLPHPSPEYIAAMNEFMRASQELRQPIDQMLQNPNDPASRTVARLLIEDAHMALRAVDETQYPKRQI